MKNNNYHDLVDRKEIADAVEFWNSKENAGRKHKFVGMTVDEAIAYWEGRAEKTDAIEQALYVYATNADMLDTDEDLILIHGLLTHPERHRLRLIFDGSYYTHRIWIHANCDSRVNVSLTIWWSNSEFTRLSNQMEQKSPRERLDFLFENFEVVYIQMPLPDNREDIDRWLREQQFD